jgi:hypothetical protein
MHLKTHNVRSGRAVGLTKHAIKAFKKAKWKKISSPTKT